MDGKNCNQHHPSNCNYALWGCTRRRQYNGVRVTGTETAKKQVSSSETILRRISPKRRIAYISRCLLHNLWGDSFDFRYRRIRENNRTKQTLTQRTVPAGNTAKTNQQEKMGDWVADGWIHDCSWYRNDLASNYRRRFQHGLLWYLFDHRWRNDHSGRSSYP